MKQNHSVPFPAKGRSGTLSVSVEKERRRGILRLVGDMSPRGLEKVDGAAPRLRLEDGEPGLIGDGHLTRAV